MAAGWGEVTECKCPVLGSRSAGENSDPGKRLTKVLENTAVEGRVMQADVLLSCSALHTGLHSRSVRDRHLTSSPYKKRKKN